jgi:hypothetical protein
MRCVRLATVICVGVLLPASAARALEYHDGSNGFRVNLPRAWRAVPTGAGQIVFASPDPLEYAFVRPILHRTSDCTAALRQTLMSSQFDGSPPSALQIARTGPRVAVARFLAGNGAVRGAALCAETSPGAGMLYGAIVPANAHAREWPNVMAVLRSFAYESGYRTPARSATALPPLRSWREPNERAFVLSVPVGWQVHGGIHRLDATHYTSGVEALSSDGISGVRLGDSRVGQCTVPGPGMNGLPPAQGTMQFCPASDAEHVASLYLRQVLARDLGLSGIQVVPTKRDDLARRAEAIPASFGLRVACSVEELRFRASQRGVPISGAVVVKTTLFHAVQGQSFIVGTLSSDVQSFWGAPERFGTLARLTGAMQASMRIDPVWWEQTQRINAEITRRTLAHMHSEAQHAQQASWDRMAAADRRSESVGYVLSGTSRLSDGQGNTYEAKAGSNYYFRGPNGVVRADVWPSSTVDLQQLTVVR